MDIFILRDGEEIGPLSEEVTQTLLNKGSVATADLAWSPGMPAWVPLSEILAGASGAESPRDANEPSDHAGRPPLGETEVPLPLLETSAAGPEHSPSVEETAAHGEDVSEMDVHRGAPTKELSTSLDEGTADEGEAAALEGEGSAAVGVRHEAPSPRQDSSPQEDRTGEAARRDVDPVGESGSTPASGDEPATAASPQEAAGSNDAKSHGEAAATGKQKAFLRYLGIAFPEDLTKEHASNLVNDAMEAPKYAERIGHWNEERLKLHPDLFAAEIHARKENRANHFFEICQSEGAEYFTKITKAHCQVLVGFLDVKFPNWDAKMESAARNYFFPAIAEKFPQLIDRQWRNHFHYGEASKTGPEPKRIAPAARLKKRPASALVAVMRGVVLGGVILGLLYAGQKMLPRLMAHYWPPQKLAEKSDSAAEHPTPIASPAPANPIAASTSPTAIAAPEKTKKNRGKVSEPSAENPAPGGMAASAPTEKPAAVASAHPPTAPDDPSMATPASPKAMAPADPALAIPPSPAVASNPPSSGTSHPTPAAESPMAAPGPMAPAAPMADGSMTPTGPMAGAPEATMAAPAPTKATVLLVIPVQIQSSYGKLKLPAGTPLKFVSRDGEMVKVSYADKTYSIPASSTDLDPTPTQPGQPSSNPPNQ